MVEVCIWLCTSSQYKLIHSHFTYLLIGCCWLFSDACAQFAIDLGLELIILYEHIYEIYGDIQGARNNFKIESYEQGKLDTSKYRLLLLS